MKSKHRKKRKSFRFTTHETRPSLVRVTLWRDWIKECRKFVARNPTVEKRNELIFYGFFFTLEGEKYEITENFPGFLHFRKVPSLRKRSIPFSAKNGIPKMDMISLQTLLDKLLVSEVMAV